MGYGAYEYRLTAEHLASRRKAFEERVAAARSLTAVARMEAHVPEGHRLVPCPACGAGSIVPESASDWPCVACELLVGPCTCRQCGGVSALARPFDTHLGDLRGSCPICGHLGRGWKPGPVAVRGRSSWIDDVLQYGTDREGRLLFPDRRVVRGRLLALEGVSGISVGDAAVVLDEDSVKVVVGEGKTRLDHMVPYPEVTSLRVAGRGEVITESGGGWMGGGFGLSGALKGAFMASVLNALTTVRRSHVESVVLLAWTGGGVTLLNTVLLPTKLAELLHPAIARLQARHREAPALAESSRGGVAGRLRSLMDLREQGLISDAEFEAQRSRILAEL